MFDAREQVRGWNIHDRNIHDFSSRLTYIAFIVVARPQGQVAFSGSVLGTSGPVLGIVLRVSGKGSSSQLQEDEN